MKVLPSYLVEADPYSTSASGLAAQRIRMNVLANNIANIDTTRNDKGEFAPYLKKAVLFQSRKIDTNKPDEQGVDVYSIQNTNFPLKKIHEPDHPESDAKGFRTIPDIHVAREMVGMIEASQAYEANLNALQITRKTLGKTSSILDDNLDG